MAKKFNIVIREKNCKQCGICSYLCPKKVLVQEMGHCPVPRAFGRLHRVQIM